MKYLYKEPLNKRALFAVLFPFFQGLLVFLCFNTSLLSFLCNCGWEISIAISIVTLLTMFTGDILGISWAVKERERYRTTCLIPILLNLGFLCVKIFAIGFLIFIFHYAPWN